MLLDLGMKSEWGGLWGWGLVFPFGRWTHFRG